MNIPFIANQLLAFATALMGVATIAEITATRQVAYETYRFVPLIRLMRKGHKVAAVLVAVFAVIACWTAPALFLPVLSLALTLGFMSQLKNFFSGRSWEDVALFGLMPLTVVLITVFSACGPSLPHSGQLHLGVPALVLAGLIAAQTQVIRSYRGHRDLLLILQG